MSKDQGRGRTTVSGFLQATGDTRSLLDLLVPPRPYFCVGGEKNDDESATSVVFIKCKKVIVKSGRRFSHLFVMFLIGCKSLVVLRELSQWSRDDGIGFEEFE